MVKALYDMALEINDLMSEKGFRDDGKTFGDYIALLHSEVSEILEAYRKDLGDEAIASEFADVLIRLIDMAEVFNVNLEQAYDDKMAFNRTRSYRHGNRKL
jgi:NTP pyrophosphatase (non-canonical NTP hydrolase)